MSRTQIVLLGLALTTLVVGSRAARNENEARSEIDKFNQKFTTLHLKMDHAGILEMWADDGVDLMPGENPLVGKKAITA
jgi:hypothetical protein